MHAVVISDALSTLIEPSKSLFSIRFQTPNGTLLVPVRKRGVFRPGKEIEGLRGGIRWWYAAQASQKIDTAGAEKDRFRMETS
jgi:hypothetical protein